MVDIEMIDTGVILKVDCETADALNEIAQTFGLSSGDLLKKIADKWLQTPKYQRGLILNFILGRL